MSGLLKTLTHACHISCGAALGVVTRLCLGHAFDKDGLGVVSETTALFIDLPSNALGSFLAGAYSPFKANVQRMYPSMHLGFMTGYLGSLTTFASWNLQATRMLVAGQWVDAIFALLIGTEVATASYAIGVDAGKAISGFVKSGHSTKPNEVDSEARLSEICGQDAQNENQPSQSASASARRDEGRGCDNGMNPSNSRIASTSLFKSTSESPPPSVSAPGTPAANSITVAIPVTIIRHLVGSAIVLSVLLSVSIAAYVVDHNWSRRTIYLSGLFGPFGALIRWQLAEMYNISSRFPLGTFVANSIAALVDVSIAAIMAGRQSSLDEQTVAQAAIGGLSGALSTVSTWVVELATLRGENVRSSAGAAYIYGGLTVAVAQLLGIVIYGSTIWAKRASGEQL